MKIHRCYVCLKLDTESKLIKAVFTRDPGEKWGHLLCFTDSNQGLVQMESPYRWKFKMPKAAVHRAGKAGSTASPGLD